MKSRKQSQIWSTGIKVQLAQLIQLKICDCVMVWPLHTLKHQNRAKRAESYYHLLSPTNSVCSGSGQQAALTANGSIAAFQSLLPKKSAGYSVGSDAQVPSVPALWVHEPAPEELQMTEWVKLILWCKSMLLNGFQWNAFYFYHSHIRPKLYWISMHSFYLA